jgi:hypothetical protein
MQAALFVFVTLAVRVWANQMSLVYRHQLPGIFLILVSAIQKATGIPGVTHDKPGVKVNSFVLSIITLIALSY